ncbi:MAG: hypothetical protein OEY79_04540 [Anaplasmataceae bacterium]|nr:hypothetical protein [Anaplasmataceae bacterium]
MLFFCFTANGMTTKEFLDYCREYNLKCTVNDERHVPGEVTNDIHNDFHNPYK